MFSSHAFKDIKGYNRNKSWVSGLYFFFLVKYKNQKTNYTNLTLQNVSPKGDVNRLFTAKQRIVFKEIRYSDATIGQECYY
jgi:hypothetical protein